MCRACHISFEDSDDVDHICKWIHPSQFESYIRNVLEYYDNENEIQIIEKSVMKESEAYLINHSQHVCINAFHDVDFAGFPRGIYGCTPHDMMHCF